MPGQEQSDRRSVLQLLRRYERAATELEAADGPVDPVTYVDDFPDGSLVVTISAERGPVTIAFHDPSDDVTVVVGLDQLRRRIADL
jgi:hypothetical protein